MKLQVHRNDSAQRYELVDGGDVIGIADYRTDGDRVVFPHTEIAPQLRGRGLGEVLVRGALDDVRQRHAEAKIIPACSFVREFVDQNPEYQDLVA